MSVEVHVLYENGQRLDSPKVFCGELKRYQNKEIKFSKWSCVISFGQKLCYHGINRM